MSSALNALIIRRPLNVSSICDISSPHLFCASNELFFKFLPTVPMIVPITGRTRNTKRVSSQLSAIIVIRYINIRIGFLNNISSELITEFSTSLTSPETRARISPLRSSEKKPMGSSSILSFILSLMSFTTPVRMGIVKYAPRYAVPVLRNVIIISNIAKNNKVVLLP